MAAAVALSAPGSVSAQSPDETQRRAIAQALFDEAQKLMEAGNFSPACIKLEEVVRLSPGKIGAVITLAKCYEGEGKLASAWSRYRNAADAAKVAGDPRAKDAQKKVEELDAKVPRLTIVVGLKAGAVVGLRVMRDGSEVSAAQWGVAIPVDPGDHHVEATAPGKQAFVTDVTLAVGATTTLEIAELVEPNPTPTATPTAAPTPTAVVTALPTADAGPTKVLGLPPRTWGFVIGGVGTLGIVAGAVAGAVALGQHDALAAQCLNRFCGADKRGDIAAYETTGLVSTIGFAAGGALAAAGVVIWLVSPASAAPPKVSVAPVVTLGGAGLVGRF
ncbi:MAG: hypothetical protein IPK82_27590 [Polyangiaceae bacterium]|nr:hypothetical protein [Polyangiaceae bacterium]